MRLKSTVKIHKVRGPRLPYPLAEAEVRDNAYSYLTADGVAAQDGEGVLYWIDTIVTTDAGGSRVYDNNAASGDTLSGAYAAKAVDSVIKNYDPPIPYYHGIYVNLTTAVVRICYRPFARNLRSRLTVTYAPGTSNVVSRVTTRVTVLTTGAARTNLVSRSVVLKEGSSDLVSRSVVLKATSLNLVSRTTVQLASYPKNLVCRVTAYYTPVTFALISRVTVLDNATKSLPCYLYADQTP